MEKMKLLRILRSGKLPEDMDLVASAYEEQEAEREQMEVSCTAVCNIIQMVIEAMERFEEQDDILSELYCVLLSRKEVNSKCLPKIKYADVVNNSGREKSLSEIAHEYGVTTRNMNNLLCKVDIQREEENGYRVYDHVIERRLRDDLGFLPMIERRWVYDE